MAPFNHILVPTDFGDAADHAADVAMDLAAKYGAKVTLVHAFVLPAVAYAEGVALPIEAMIQAAESALDKALLRVKEQYPHTSGLLIQGEPWEQILAVAKNQHADMIVMGTHGRRGLSRVFLGSVAEKVVRLSPIPVLTVSSAGWRAEKAAATAPSLRTA